MLSLGPRAHEDFSFDRRAGRMLVLTAPDGKAYGLDVENFVPEFPAGLSSSSSSGGQPHPGQHLDLESGVQPQEPDPDEVKSQAAKMEVANPSDPLPKLSTWPIH